MHSDDFKLITEASFGPPGPWFDGVPATSREEPSRCRDDRGGRGRGWTHFGLGCGRQSPSYGA